jgi:hypothetical protein
MLILIDRDELRMVAAAANRKWINLVGYVDYPGKRLVVADSLEGKTWTVLDAEEMATMFKNMSGQDAPPYATAIEQLRAYADTWPNYPKSEAQLEREAEAIYAEEQAADEDAGIRHLAQAEVSRETHQGCIEMAEAARESLAPGEAAQASVNAPAPKPTKPSSGEPVERPKQGITKRIWEIADELLSVTGSVGNLKEFRSKVIERASAEGANAGTAATQFGKWKTSKGL